MGPPPHGQHFLIDEALAKREVIYAEISKDDVVLEIGPGKGVLTHLLAAQAKRVLAVEIDDRLVSFLSSRLPRNVELINGDILKIPLASMPRFTKIVSNIPYEISSPLTFMLLDQPFKVGVLIYQKEFAERMIASPGTSAYCRLSVGVYYKATCELLEVVPRSSFKPQPQVDSAVIQLKPRSKPPFTIPDEAFFFSLTRVLFNHRRKRIKTILRRHLGGSIDQVPYGDQRVEELTPEEIARISTYLMEKGIQDIV
jgi:16S rRNA (adenine1518-N6/adenine1519-N6)-dimethyltransferase